MARFDLYTTIHKALRNMLCDLGGQMRMNDFTDKDATAEVIAKTKYYLQLFYEHALSEEQSIHSQMRAFVPEIVDRLEREHQAIEERGAVIKEIILELPDSSEPAEMITIGMRLHQAFNAYQAFFLEHINYEEATFLPMTQQHYDDEQLAAMRTDILAHTTPERGMEWLGWMFASGDVNELAELLANIEASPLPPEAIQGIRMLAQNAVGEERWGLLQKRAA
jgi:hemerythrin-like domain-containing protein